MMSHLLWISWREFFLRPKSSSNIFSQRYLGLLWKRNIFDDVTLSDYLRIFSKFSLKNVFQQNWDRDGFWLATTVYRLYRHQKPIVWFQDSSSSSCHLIGQVSWSGLWLVHRWWQVTWRFMSDFPLLCLTYTVESVNVRFFVTYYYCLPYIYNFLITFSTLRRKYKIQRFCVV